MTRKSFKPYYLLALLSCAILFAGCGDRKKHFTDPDMSFREGAEYAYKDGKVFTGDVWTSDDETLHAVYDKGRIIHAEFFYKGKKVLKEFMSRDSTAYYNKNGETITRSEFDELYPDAKETFEAFNPEIEANKIE